MFIGCGSIFQYFPPSKEWVDEGDICYQLFHLFYFCFQHTRQPSVTEAADEKTVERRKRRKADYEEVVRRGKQLQLEQVDGWKMIDSNEKEHLPYYFLSLL